MDFEEIDLSELLEGNFSIVTEEINLSDKEVNKAGEENQIVFPILPVRNMVMFPQIIAPITAGRNNSKKLLEDAQKEGQLVGILSQKNGGIENPKLRDLYETGTIVRIIRSIKLPDGNTTVITKGVGRFKIDRIVYDEPYIQAEIKKLREVQPKDKDIYEALQENIKDLALKIIRLDPNIPNAANFAINNMVNSGHLVNFVCNNANFSIEEKQSLLEERNLQKRAEKCYELLVEEYKRLELRNQIHKKIGRAHV